MERSAVNERIHSNMRLGADELKIVPGSQALR